MRSRATDDFSPRNDSACSDDPLRAGDGTPGPGAAPAEAGAPGDRIASVARHRRPRPPRTPPPHRPDDAALLGRAILDAARAARATDALLVRAQIAQVDYLHAGERFHRLGFAGLDDATREMVGMESRTARERLTLRRIFDACPAGETAFLEGRLSRCQALALGRVLRTRGVDAEAWIAEAAGLSVRAIRERVRAWSREQPHEGEREGTEVGFEIPSTMLLAWEQGLEEARSALGESAPVWRCMEAVLAETGFAGSSGEEARGAVSSAGTWIDGSMAGASRVDGSMAGVSMPGCAPAAGAPSDPAGRPAEARRHEPIPIRVPAAMAERVRGDLETFREHQDDVGDLLDAREPRDAFDALEGLQAIERLRAPLKILLARLVRDLRDLRAAPALGYASLAEMLAAELALAERTARRLIETATALDEAPILEREVGRGRLSMGKALVARRLGGGSRLPQYVERARMLTHRAFEEEVGFLWLLRRCVPEIWRRFPGPLPQEGLEEALIEEIRLWSRPRRRGKGAPATRNGTPIGHAEPCKPLTRAELLAELHRRFGALDPEASLDPAENPVVLERLKALLEKLVLLIWEDGEPLDRPTSARLGRTVRVRFWAPWPVASDFRAAIRLIRARAAPENPPELPPMPAIVEWQAALLLVGSAVRIWNAQQDPAAARTLRARILARDRRRCMAPGCTRRRMLEIHHGVYRSRGGSNEAANLKAVCYGHHHGVLHQGYARQGGSAPQSLTWELGCRPGRPPLLHTRGQRRLEA